MSQSIDGIYYVWGEFEGKHVLSPQSTKYQSFEAILRANNRIHNMKIFGKLIEFEDSFLKNGFYSKNFKEIQKLGSGSFGSVSKVKIREDSDYYRWIAREYSAIKRIEFTSVDKNEIREYRIREYFNYKKMTRDCSENENLVKHFDAWFEESVVENVPKICLYIQMELCDKTLVDVINEFKNDSKLKTTESLTTIGYYIASQIFIQILEGVNYLHTRKKAIIHRDLKPDNILLKKCDQKGICVKIADFGLIAIHEFPEKSHTLDKGPVKYMAPEVGINNKYDTKADIYSLGVIFQNLFALNMNE
jgi:serine/threonine protein kinase